MSKTPTYDSFGNEIPENHKVSSVLINTIDTAPKVSYTTNEVWGIIDSMAYKCERRSTRQSLALEALSDRNFHLEELIRKIKAA